MKRTGFKYRYEYWSRGGKWVKWSPSLKRDGSKQPDKYWVEIDFAIEAPMDSLLGRVIVRFTEEV